MAATRAWGPFSIGTGGPGTFPPDEEALIRVQSGQLVAPGYGAIVRSDEVTAIQPITEGRGPDRRTLVWVHGLPEAVVASRSEGSIVDDLVTPAEEAARIKAQRSVLQHLATVIAALPAR